jgi:hypothetical protein
VKYQTNQSKRDSKEVFLIVTRALAMSTMREKERERERESERERERKREKARERERDHIGDLCNCDKRLTFPYLGSMLLSHRFLC